MKPIIVDYNKKTHKRCIKCRTWKPRQDVEGFKPGFGRHPDSSDNLQSICYACKNLMNNKAREKNVTARVRHHTATRCLTQLGKPLVPKNFVTNLEDYLGYRISALVRHLSKDLKTREDNPKRKLRDALNEGYHIDHIHPLSKFPIIVSGDDGDEVDWEEFRKCWAIKNLTAIPALENLQKGAKTK